MSSLIPYKSIASTVNSTSNESILDGESWTGTWEQNNIPYVTTNVVSDQNVTYKIQFSIDGGTTVQTTLTYQYNTFRINPPHSFRKDTRAYRLIVENNSGSTATVSTLSEFGMAGVLNAPINGTLSENYDATVVRPTDYFSEVAMGKRQGRTVWNKFGFNLDVDTGTEIIASWGGAFNPTTDIMTANDTFTITYDGTGGGSTDGAGTTGATQLLIYYVYFDAAGDLVSGLDFHTLGTDGSDVTSFSGAGINRAIVYANGGLGWNANDITFTATTDATVQAEIPATQAITQQCIFHTQTNHNFLADWARFKMLKSSGGGSGDLIGYSWSRVTGTRYEIFREPYSTTNTSYSTIELNPSQKFVIGGMEVLYFVLESAANNEMVSGRFSGIEERIS